MRRIFRRAYVFLLLLRIFLLERRNSAYIKNYQNKKLRQLIKYIYKNTQYYKQLFDKHAIRPQDIKTTEDLNKIPALAKDILRQHYDDIVCDRNRDYVYVNTTGSSGLPLRIAMNRQDVLFSDALVLYAFLKGGLSISNKIAMLWGETKSQDNNSSKWFYFLKRYVVDLKAGPEKNIEQLNNIKPQGIYGYPSYLRLLAKHILEHNLKLSFTPKVIFTHGEILTDDTRDLLRKAFNARVCNTYGSTEFFRIAFECKKGSMHIIPESAIIETMDGKALITGLYHRAMPFLRYDLGDKLVLSEAECGCGIHWGIIKEVVGRSDDYLVLPSGKQVSARAVNLLDNVRGILEYQVVQNTKEDINVLVRPDSEFSEASEKEIKEIILRGCYGEAVNIKIVKLESMPRQGAGKLRAVISRVSENDKN